MNETYSYREILEGRVMTRMLPMFEQLDKMWRTLGLSPGEVDIRIATVEDRVYDITRPMLVCEEENMDKVVQICHGLKEEISRTWVNMKLPGQPELSTEELTLIEEQKDLKHRLAQLQDQRSKTMERFSSMIKEERNLAEILGLKMSLDDYEAVPDEEDVKKIKENISRMSAVKEERENSMFAIKEDILRLMERLDMDLNSTSILSLMDGDNVSGTLKLSDLRSAEHYMDKLKTDLEQRSIETTMLTTEIISLYDLLKVPEVDHILSSYQISRLQGSIDEKTLNLLRKEVEKLRIMKKINMKKIVEMRTTTLGNLWDMGMIGNKTKTTIIEINTSSHEITLENIEMKIREMKEYIQEHEITLEKVALFMERFELAEDLKKRMGDQNRLFTSRGNSMMKEEKDRKKVNELPILSEELRSLAEEKGNIEIYDVPLVTLVEDHMSRFHSQYGVGKSAVSKSAANKSAANKSAECSGTTRSGRSFVSKTNQTSSPRSMRRAGRLVTAATPGGMRVVASSMAGQHGQMKTKDISMAGRSAGSKPHHSNPMVKLNNESLVNNTIDQSLFTNHVQHNSTRLLGSLGDLPGRSPGPDPDNTVVLSGHIDMLVSARNRAERLGSSSRGDEKVMRDEGQNKTVNRRKMRRSNSCSDISLANFRHQRIAGKSKLPMPSGVAPLPAIRESNFGRTTSRIADVKRQPGLTRSNSCLVRSASKVERGKVNSKPVLR